MLGKTTARSLTPYPSALTLQDFGGLDFQKTHYMEALREKEKVTLRNKL